MKLSLVAKNLLTITFFGIILSINVSAQYSEKTFQNIPILDSLDVEKVVTYFQVENAQLKGDGAKILEHYISNSKFFVLGENHNSHHISKLTESLVPLLDKSGYKVAAFEVGPLSAKKLKELSKVPDSTEARLKVFNRKYFTPSMKMSAIPMFNAIVDAAFLKAFAEKKMEIWGIDQEFFFSVLFLAEDLVESKSDDPNYEKIKAAWVKAKITTEALFDKMPNGVLTKVFTHPDFQEFEKMFDSNDLYAQEVFKRLHETKDIYQSHHKYRVDYIRSHFLKNYLSYEKEHQEARYFIKIGSYHASMTSRSMGYFDVGSLTQEIANTENARSTNVIIPRAKHDGKDYIHETPSLLNFYKKDSWAIINLEKLRKDLKANKFQIITHPDTRELNRIINGFDLLLIPPQDKTPVDNR